MLWSGGLLIATALTAAHYRPLATPFPRPTPRASATQSGLQLDATQTCLTWSRTSRRHPFSFRIWPEAEGAHYSAILQSHGKAREGSVAPEYYAGLLSKLAVLLPAATEEPGGDPARHHQELTVTSGSRSWTIVFSRPPGPAQRQILHLLNAELPGWEKAALMRAPHSHCHQR